MKLLLPFMKYFLLEIAAEVVVNAEDDVAAVRKVVLWLDGMRASSVIRSCRTIEPIKPPEERQFDSDSLAEIW